MKELIVKNASRFVGCFIIFPFMWGHAHWTVFIGLLALTLRAWLEDLVSDLKDRRGA